MASLYNRYIPPSAKTTTTAKPITDALSRHLGKRKRTESEEAASEKPTDDCSPKPTPVRNELAVREKEKKRNKRRKESGEEGAGGDVKAAKKKKKKKRRAEESAGGDSEVETAAVVDEADDLKPVKKEKKKKRSREDNAAGDAEKAGKKSKKRRDAGEHDEDTDTKAKKEGDTTEETKSASITQETRTEPSKDDDASAAPRNSILDKLRKSMAKSAARKASKQEAEQAQESEAIAETETVSAVGLVPIPQPEEVVPPKGPSLLASLPSWIAKPIIISPSTKTPFAKIQGLSPRLQQKLSSQGIEQAFAVQSAVLPLLLQPNTGDLCVSAATGSGKTLSYVLPVVQSLASRVVTRLRAIIVVPTRELVQQVNTVATSLVSGTGLKVGAATGARSLASEQAAMVFDEDGEQGSRIDILITTPGRLVEHVRSTPGFRLTYVKWLIIDEADRLVAQSFQEWVEVVIGGLESSERMVEDFGGLNLGDFGFASTPRDPVRKVMLSATMTKDVGKLAELRLRNPALVVVSDTIHDIEMDDADEKEFSVPQELNEHAIAVSDIEYKPLYLLYLLRTRNITKGVLVFVKSNEAAARLAKLIETVEPTRTVAQVSGEMEKKRREKVLRRFGRGDISILVCSDLVSRGMDLPNVEHVVNYDIPVSAQAYVHRVGRTARAGNKGAAWTLLVNKEARWFWKALGKGIQRSRAIERVGIELEGQGLGLRAVYEQALGGGK